jgi:hypothetical protein
VKAPHLFHKAGIVSGGVYHRASDIFLELIDEYCEVGHLRPGRFEVDREDNGESKGEPERGVAEGVIGDEGNKPEEKGRE